MMGFGAEQLIPISVGSGILLAGVVDDLRSRKFHNWLFLVCSGVALIAVFATSGVSGLGAAALGFLCGALCLLPLVLGGAVGAGDMKLLAAFGIIAGWPAVVSVAIYALFWGALFGVARTVANKQGSTLTHNIAHLLLFRRATGLELQKFPYTIALLFGWMSWLSVGGVL